MTLPVAPESPERQIAFDMAKRALPVAPVLVALGAIGWGVHGALSAGFGLALVVVNLLVAAISLAWAARISPAALMATALGGFLVRMTLLVIAVALVKHQAWVAVVPLGITIVVSHLGLLFWETKHISASLAFPGLKPTRTGA